MNSQKFNELADHYIAAFAEINGPQHIEYYKWQIARQFKPAIDDALKASDEELPKKLYAVKKLTRNIIDNYTTPFNGLIEFAKKEPATVRKLLSGLLAAADASIEEKQKAISDFLIGSHTLREKYYPDSYLYKDDMHSATTYLFLYDPDHNYLFKASHCGKFADCIEFYEDWGSGDNINLDVFYRMCDQCVDMINQNKLLLETAASRYEIDPEGMHADTAKHILLFDMIYCSITYDLYDGIKIISPKGADRKLIQEMMEKARGLKAALDEAEEKLHLLNTATLFIQETYIPGKQINHRKYGAGTIKAVEDGRMVVAFDTEGEKELGIIQSAANGIVSVDDAGYASRYDEYRGLLQNEGKIRNAVTIAGNLLAPYVEYLD